MWKQILHVKGGGEQKVRENGPEARKNSFWGGNPEMTGFKAMTRKGNTKEGPVSKRTLASREKSAWKVSKQKGERGEMGVEIVKNVWGTLVHRRATSAKWGEKKKRYSKGGRFLSAAGKGRLGDLIVCASQKRKGWWRKSENWHAQGKKRDQGITVLLNHQKKGGKNRCPYV